MHILAWHAKTMLLKHSSETDDSAGGPKGEAGAAGAGDSFMRQRQGQGKAHGGGNGGEVDKEGGESDSLAINPMPY